MDPTEVATGRTQFDLTAWVAAEGVDWGDAAIEQYLAEAHRGQLPVDYRIPNRQVTIPLMVQNRGTVTFEQARKQIQQKVGLFQREGGYIKRVTTGGTVYADVTTATLKLGGNWLQANRSADIDASLVLETIPDFYGTEIRLATHLPLTNLVLDPSFEAATIGDHWGTYSTTGTNTSITKVATTPFVGSNVARVTAGVGDSYMGVVGGHRVGTNYQIPIEGGKTYSTACYSRAVTTARQCQALMAWYGPTGHISSSGGATVINSNAGWTRTPVLAATAPANATKVSVYGAVLSVVNTEQHYFDGVMLLEGAYTDATFPTYFDGATTGYGWTGTANDSTSKAITVPELTFTETAIKGDHPGRVRIVANNQSNTDPQRGLMWGIRSRYYTADATAALSYEAEALTPLDASTVGALTGASGGNAVSHPGVATDWTPILSTGTLSHKGTYRVWARVRTPANPIPMPELRFLWDVGGLAVPHDNTPVRLPGFNNFFIVNLGEIRLTEPFLANHNWQGVIQGRDVAEGLAQIYIDKIWFEPQDEGSGVLRTIPDAQITSDFHVMDELSSGSGALAGAGVAGERMFSGPRIGGTGSSDTTVGTLDWDFLSGNMDLSDNQHVTCVMTGGQTTRYLRPTNFGFALPSGVTIRGIVVEVERKQVGSTVRDFSVRLFKAGVAVGTAKTLPGTWSTSDTVARYGSSADLWGTTWTEAEIEATGFGVGVAATQSASAGAETAAIDRITITVYHSGTETWAGAGDADDFTFTTAWYTRTAVSDTNVDTGRYAVATTQVLTDSACRMHMNRGVDMTTGRRGMLLRYTDTNNWLWGGIRDLSASDKRATILKRVGGTVVTLADISWTGVTGTLTGTGAGPTVEMIFAVTATGYAFLWLFPNGLPYGEPVLTTYHADLATGGGLASGRVGFYDAYTAATAVSRAYAGFSAWVPSFDAVLPAGTGAAELTTQGMFTRTSGGLAAVSNVQGRLPRIPPTGMENRSVQVLLKASRGDFEDLPDSAIEDLTADVFYRPSWLFVAS